MAVINRDMTINDVIKAFPSTLPVFNDFGIDSCCGGSKTLEQAAIDAKVDVGAFLDALKAMAK